MKILLLLASCLFLLHCTSSKNSNPQLLIDTSYGEIEVELYPAKAPKTVAAFLSYVDSGFYTNSTFYRVVLLEGMSANANVGLVQGGIWQTNDKHHANVPGIEHESTQQTGLSHTTGTISLARTTPGTASTEFFICIGDQTQFNYGNTNPADGQGFAAFGKVIKGMQVVRSIQQQKKQGESFTEKIIIKEIRRM